MGWAWPSLLEFVHHWSKQTCILNFFTFDSHVIVVFCVQHYGKIIWYIHYLRRCLASGEGIVTLSVRHAVFVSAALVIHCSLVFKVTVGIS